MLKYVFLVHIKPIILSYLRQVVTKRKGSKPRRTTFQSQLDLKLEGVGLEDLRPDMSSDNLQWLLSQEKPLMGLTQKSC